jgi:hypothetical protein
MLIENRVYDKSVWLKEFRKKFNNFCNKLPMYVDYSIVGDDLILLTFHFNEGQNSETLEFNIDYKYDPQKNISNIKSYLIDNNYYPIINFVEHKNISLEIQEIQKLIDEGTDPAIASATEKETIKKTAYRIEKIHDKENKISLRKISDNKIYLYYMKIPIVKFIELLNKNLKEAENLFWKNSDLIKCL